MPIDLRTVGRQLGDVVRIVAIALVVIGVATPAFAQFQQLRQFGAGPNPNPNWSDRYDRNDGYNRNDGTYMQPSQRTSPNGYPGDSYNTIGNYPQNQGIYLTTPNFSR